jgi:hypothetical protein
LLGATTKQGGNLVELAQLAVAALFELADLLRGGMANLLALLFDYIENRDLAARRLHIHQCPPRTLADCLVPAATLSGW